MRKNNTNKHNQTYFNCWIWFPIGVIISVIIVYAILTVILNTNLYIIILAGIILSVSIICITIIILKLIEFTKTSVSHYFTIKKVKELEKEIETIKQEIKKDS